ncbi:hypothetical protein AB3R30_07715 [Leptolyngbyaceae cyanobacterium UHCC 1019]
MVTQTTSGAYASRQVSQSITICQRLIGRGLILQLGTGGNVANSASWIAMFIMRDRPSSHALILQTLLRVSSADHCGIP